MNPTEFFTLEDVATFAGATLLTVIVTNVVRDLLGYNPKLVAFVTALVIQITVWGFIAPGDWKALAMAVFNAFLVYMGATGANQIGHALLSGRTEASVAQSFWEPWW